MWSEERKRGSGQALVAGSVVQGEKPWPRVKHWWREVWSVGQNCGFGSSTGGGKCGPGREIMVLGQTLVAGSVVRGEKNRALGQTLPRPSVVRGSKTVPRVKPAPA